MNTRRLVSTTTFLFFVFTVSSHSTEYICSCEKHNAIKITIKNGKSKTERESTCSGTKEKILLEYEEGYIAIGDVNGSGLYPYDNITEDNKNFVKAVYRGKSSNSTLNFNKKSKTLRENQSAELKVDAVYSGNTLITPSYFSDYKSNTKRTCKEARN